MHKTAGAALLAVLAAGCAGAQEGKPAVTVGPFAGKRAAGCPAGDFEGFFAKFSDSVEVQRAFTSIPLRFETIDAAAEPEPAKVSRLLRSDQVEYPLLPTQQEAMREGLVSRVSKEDASHVVVMLAKPDTDYQKTFHFSSGDCWKLEKVVDDSL